MAKGRKQRAHVSKYRTTPAQNRLPKSPPHWTSEPDGAMLFALWSYVAYSPDRAATRRGCRLSGRDDT